MREDVRLRVMQAAEHILETGATVRACAAKYGVSKTTIHKDMRARLPRIDGQLYRAVDAILKRNLEERHIRGGAATREKFRRCRMPSGREEGSGGLFRPGQGEGEPPMGETELNADESVT